VAGERDAVLRAGDRAAGGVELLGAAGPASGPRAYPERADDEQDEEDDRDRGRFTDSGLSQRHLSHPFNRAISGSYTRLAQPTYTHVSTHVARMTRTPRRMPMLNPSVISLLSPSLLKATRRMNPK